MLAEELNTKWKPVLEHSDLPEITDAHVKMYRESGLIESMLHPLNFGGKRVPLLEWMVE
jgi:hypothetical protein